MILYQVFQFCQLEFVRRGKYGSHLNHCHRSREASKRMIDEAIEAGRLDWPDLEGDEPNERY